MKKVLSVIAVVVFLGALSAPVYSSNDLKPVVIQVNDEKPKKKKEASKKEAKKAKTSKCASACGEKKAKACGDKDKK